jgi:hypothetical protein
MTVNGVTTTKGLGQEQHELFSPPYRGKHKELCQYDYRHTDGELFSCVKPTLELCREARDNWLKGRKKNNGR